MRNYIVGTITDRPKPCCNIDFYGRSMTVLWFTYVAVYAENSVTP